MIEAVNDPAAQPNEHDSPNTGRPAPTSPATAATPKIVTSKRGKSRRASVAAGAPGSATANPLIIVDPQVINAPAVPEAASEVALETTSDVETAGQQPSASESPELASPEEPTSGPEAEPQQPTSVLMSGQEQLSDPVAEQESTPAAELSPALSDPEADQASPETSLGEAAPQDSIPADPWNSGSTGSDIKESDSSGPQRGEPAEPSEPSESIDSVTDEPATAHEASAQQPAEPVEIESDDSSEPIAEPDFLNDAVPASQTATDTATDFLDAPSPENPEQHPADAEESDSLAEPAVLPVALPVSERLAEKVPEQTPEPTLEQADATSLQGAPVTRQSLRAREAAREHAKDVAHPERKAGRKVLAWLRRALLLLLIMLLVLAIGSTVKSKAPAGPSATELARVSALAEAQTLLTQAKLLAAKPPSSAVSPALKNSVGTLEAGISALTIPAASPSPSATVSSSAAAPTVTSFLKALDQNASKNLEAARLVEPGLARLLSAFGAGQAIAGQYLAQLGKLEHQPVQASTPANNITPSSCATATPAASDGPASQQQALTAVDQAEQKAIYAYQVAATRLETEQASDLALKLLAGHQTALEQARQHLSSRCLQLPAQQPGFPLSAAFLASPNTELATLENQLGVVYGDLIGLSDGSLRDWAISQLLATGRQALIFGAPQNPLPGLPQ